MSIRPPAPTQTSVAELLERSAIRVESSPGLNVLDAIREESAEIPKPSRDEILVDTFYRLLDYLPPYVDSLEHWSDTETSDRVAGKLRQLARTMRNGGPAHVDAIASPATSDEADLVEQTTGRNRGSTHRRRPEAEWDPASQLRQERGRLLSALTRMRRAKHPNGQKILDAELRVAEIDRDLASTGEQGSSDAADGMAAAGNAGSALPAAETPDDHRAVALILESRQFPRERTPVAS